tara:strand:- start:102 stop:758 length:657 start_codon:yes stop_codon:yes gene_type:complete
MSSNTFGYIADTGPEQAFRSNTGVFNPADINELIAENKWTNFGQLEFIETQTYSSDVSTIEFNDIKQDIYNVHFMTFNNISMAAGTNNFSPTIQLRESGTYETASVYQFNAQNGLASGSFSESKSTAVNYIVALASMKLQDNNLANGYCYFYNLGDSTKYSFATSHQIAHNQNLIGAMNFQAGVLPQTSTVDGIRFIFTNTTKLFGSFDISLYGIRFA